MERFIIRRKNPDPDIIQAGCSTPTKRPQPQNELRSHCSKDPNPDIIQIGCSTPTKRPQPQNEQSTPKRTKYTHKAYDKDQRKRTFQTSWITMFPWVKYESGSGDNDLGFMFCATCREYPDIADQKSPIVLGCSSFRIDSLKSHSKSTEHYRCTVKKKKANMTVQERESSIAKAPLAKSVNRGDEIGTQILIVMFNTVYMLAKRGKPLADYEVHMDLHIKNRKDLGGDYFDIGSNYQTARCAKGFLMAIAEQLRCETVKDIARARFYTVLADGSTDSSYVEQYVVLVRYVNDKGVPVTRMASIEAVESANATGVLNGIEAGMKKLGLGVQEEGKPTVVGVNFDGAAVMMGCKTGVSTVLKEKHPHLIPVHCVAHKLELGVLDAAKSVTYLEKFESTIKILYKFYQRSPKRRRDLQAIADMLASETLRYGDVKAVRWVASKSKALVAVSQNLKTTLAHLEHAAANNRTDEGSKAKHLLKEMESVRFVNYLYFMQDYLKLISITSQKFQKNMLLIIEVEELMDNLKAELEMLTDEPGEKTQQFYKELNTETLQLEDSHPVPIQLKGPKPTEYNSNKSIQDLLRNSIQYLENRFQIFKEKPLKSFSVFNWNFWPRDESSLVKFGRPEIRDLTDHFKALLTEDERTSCLREWTTLKNRLKRQRCGNLAEVYCELLAANPEEIKNILVLVRVMVTISPSTAECERQFSAMNNIKTNLRTCLNQDTLEALLRVKAGPDLRQYNPAMAIYRWKTSGTGTRHLGGHTKTQKSQP